MTTNKNRAKRQVYFYFYAGLNHEHQELLAAVKAKMAQGSGEAPKNLDIMIELMRRYVDHKQ